MEKHKWSEADEKALIELSVWTDELPQDVLAACGGKWKLVSARMYSDRNITVSATACRKRVSDIASREKKNEAVVVFNGVDFPQEQSKSESELILERIVGLETSINSLVQKLKKVDELEKRINELDSRTCSQIRLF